MPSTKNAVYYFLFGWIDTILYFFIHLAATISAVIFVAKNNNSKSNRPTSAEEIIQRRRRTPINGEKRHRKPLINAFQNVPNEILILIFENLKSKDLYNCTRVNKQWNTLVTPILWRSPVPIRPILSCIASFGAMDKKNKTNHVHQKSHLSPRFPIHNPNFGLAVRTLDLSKIATHVTDCTIRLVTRCSPHMTSLSLSQCRLITDEGLRCLSRSAVAPQLQVLVLENCRQITDLGLSYLTEKCHALHTIHFGGCQRITDTGISHLVTESGSTLRRIRLSDCSRVTANAIHTISRVCGARLEWLDISRIRSIRHTDLDQLLDNCPNITRLSVAMRKPRLHREAHAQAIRRRQLFHSHEDDEETFVQNIEDTAQQTDVHPLDELLDLLQSHSIYSNLTERSARHQRELIHQRQERDSVSDRTVELIALRLKHLEHLDLSYWTCLTDRAIHMLSEHSRFLTWLNLVGCKSVTKKVLKYLSECYERNEKSGWITYNDLVISNTQDPTWAMSSSCSSPNIRRFKV
jgi:hypothetical protein